MPGAAPHQPFDLVIINLSFLRIVRPSQNSPMGEEILKWPRLARFTSCLLTTRTHTSIKTDKNRVFSFPTMVSESQLGPTGHLKKNPQWKAAGVAAVQIDVHKQWSCGATTIDSMTTLRSGCVSRLLRHFPVVPESTVRGRTAWKPVSRLFSHEAIVKNPG